MRRRRAKIEDVRFSVNHILCRRNVIKTQYHKRQRIFKARFYRAKKILTFIVLQNNQNVKGITYFISANFRIFCCKPENR